MNEDLESNLGLIKKAKTITIPLKEYEELLDIKEKHEATHKEWDKIYKGITTDANTISTSSEKGVVLNAE